MLQRDVTLALPGPSLLARGPEASPSPVRMTSNLCCLASLLFVFQKICFQFFFFLNDANNVRIYF